MTYRHEHLTSFGADFVGDEFRERLKNPERDAEKMTIEHANAAIAPDGLVEVFAKVWMGQATEWPPKGKGGGDVKGEGSVRIAQVNHLAGRSNEAIMKFLDCLLNLWYIFSNILRREPRLQSLAMNAVKLIRLRRVSALGTAEALVIPPRLARLR